MSRADIVREARARLGVPFIHQGHLNGIAFDCAGLVGDVAIACRRVPANLWELAARFGGYARSPHAGLLEAACGTFFTPIPLDEIEVGDVLGMRFDKETQHLAILVDHPLGLGIVHALQRARKVIEHRYAGIWVERTTCAWRMGPVNG